MLRRFAGWLMALYPDDQPTLACSLGMHTPGSLRINGRWQPVECEKRGCPIVREIRREAFTSKDMN